jgi:hypothetical protein
MSGRETRGRWPASSTQQLIDLTVRALRFSADGPSRPAPPAVVLAYPLRLIGVVIDDFDLRALIDLDRRLELTAEGENPDLVTDLLSATGRTTAQIGGHSGTSLARRLLDGLPGMLTTPCTPDGNREGGSPLDRTSGWTTQDVVMQHARQPPAIAVGPVTWRPPNREHHQLSETEQLAVHVVALRLAQLATWLCERERGNPEAHELLPRCIEASFVLASLPLRLLRPRADTRDGQAPSNGPQQVDVEPIDDQARVIWQRHLRNDRDPLSLLRRREDLRMARTRWLELLASAERYPALLRGGPTLMERRLAMTVRRDPAVPTPSDLGCLRRVLHVFQADEPLLTAPPARTSAQTGSGASPTRESDPQPTLAPNGFRFEQQQLLELTSGHLLPRYLMDLTFGLLLALRDEHMRRFSQPPLQRLWRLASRTLMPVMAAVGLSALLAAMAAPLLVGLGTGPPPRALAQSLQFGLLTAAGAWLLLTAAVVGVGGREGSYLALLRMPATTAFGLAILLSFASDWLRPPTAWATAAVPLGLMILAFGYLFIETVNQGAEGLHALGRAALLGLIGAGVAFAATAGVTFALAPAFFGPSNAYQVMAASPARFLWAVLLASSAAFALGTFLQAIWDEAPVTAPLSRLRLR